MSCAAQTFRAADTDSLARECRSDQRHSAPLAGEVCLRIESRGCADVWDSLRSIVTDGRNTVRIPGALAGGVIATT